MTKYGPARFGGAGVENPGDVDVVHDGERLPLGLEAGNDLAAVHAGLDDLEGDFALDRLGLLGHEDRAHAAFADLLEQFVRADLRAGGFGRDDGGRLSPTHRVEGFRGHRWRSGLVQESVWYVVDCQQCPDPLE